MEGWREGVTAGWRDGRMEGRRVSGMEGLRAIAGKRDRHLFSRASILSNDVCVFLVLIRLGHAVTFTIPSSNSLAPHYF